VIRALIGKEELAQKLNTELEKSSERYHVMGAWVAIIFDPLFALTDFFNIPNAWSELFVIRLSVSLITFAGIILRKKFHYPSYVIVFIPFFLISLQNAYTYTKIDIPQFTGHTLNYIALWIGAGMFILWRWQFSAVIIASSAIANVIFFNMNHKISLQEALVNGGLLLIVVGFFMIMLIQTRYRLTVKNIYSQLALEHTNAALIEEKSKTDKQNKNILDSIRYAKRIQTALLPKEDKIAAVLQDFFVYYAPKDLVSGDFYWFAHDDNKNETVLVTADCTGHGVPGAFMSVIGDALLNEILHIRNISRPDLILNEMHLGIRERLNQSDGETRDGMDAVICKILWNENKLQFAGGMNSLFFADMSENQPVLNEIKGDKKSLGGSLKKNETERFFTLHELPLHENMIFYTCSDGYADEIGGPEDKKYSTRKFKELLLSLLDKKFDEQKEILDKEIRLWLGDNKQIDDILVIGFRGAKK
jgi:serine phosphatase RsbU (regulator of sigma subunit)